MQVRGRLVTGLVLIASSFGCVGNDDDRDDGGAGGAVGTVLTGGSGNDGGAVGTVLTGGGGGGFELCSESVLDGGGAPLSRDELGWVNARVGLSREGQVSHIADDRIEVLGDDGSTYVGGWRGPALGTAFAVGDSVQLTAGDDYGFGGAVTVSVLRSATATAMMINAAPWRLMATEPGSTAELPRPSGLPTLVYGVGACCASGGRSHVGEHFKCDYSALQATFGDDTTAIPLGGTGAVGPWSVTNLHSVYYTAWEHFWAVQVTLLGPATPGAVDGGL